MKERYVICVISDSCPEDMENTLNNYAELGWRFKSVISYHSGKMVLIFEKESET
jgi:hypothetical protein